MGAPRLSDVIDAVNALWPPDGAEDWDSVGLVTGSHDAEINSVLFVVDVTDATVSQAVDGGYDLIVAHHPHLLRAVTSVAEDRFKGHAISRLIRAGCGLLTVHTNGDRVVTGTSSALASVLGVTDTVPLVPHPLGGGLGVRGRVTPTTLGEFSRHIASVIPATAGGVRVSGNMTHPISTVAICAGAGDGLLAHTDVVSADVYVTSDLRHHPASEFRENARLVNDTALVDISHWAAEWVWLETAAAELRSALTGVAVDVSDLNTDPWTFAVVQ